MVKLYVLLYIKQDTLSSITFFYFVNTKTSWPTLPLDLVPSMPYSAKSEQTAPSAGVLVQQDDNFR